MLFEWQRRPACVECCHFSHIFYDVYMVMEDSKDLSVLSIGNTIWHNKKIKIKLLLLLLYLSFENWFQNYNIFFNETTSSIAYWGNWYYTVDCYNNLQF